MPRRTKDVEIELSDGTSIEVTLKVDGFYDDQYLNPDTGDAGQWLVNSWEADHDYDLDDEQQAEFDEEIEEIVFSEKWHFEHALDEDESDELEE